MSQEEMIANPKIQSQPHFNSIETKDSQFSAANLNRIRELQTANDELHRQVTQMEKDIAHSADALTLIAERERCLILIARNSGEITKIHLANEERLRRMAELEAKNKRLSIEIVAERDNFMDVRDPHARARHAANFFLTQSRIEKNADELFELGQQ